MTKLIFYVLKDMVATAIGKQKSWIPTPQLIYMTKNWREITMIQILYCTSTLYNELLWYVYTTLESYWPTTNQTMPSQERKPLK